MEQLKSEISSYHEASRHNTSRHTTEDQESTFRHSQTRRIDVGVGGALARHDCDEFGIEGLTIVLHMRGKDDLVINTDLEKESVCGHGR